MKVLLTENKHTTIHTVAGIGYNLNGLVCQHMLLYCTRAYQVGGARLRKVKERLSN